MMIAATCASLGWAQSDSRPEPRRLPLWEYGAGFGYAHFEQYPAADQFSNLFLPFPTFQYRGEVLRADDREGARAYLLKGSEFALELSGEGLPALESDDNDARRGMDDLPWMLAIGPQIFRKWGDEWQLQFGIFPAISTDFVHTRQNGQIYRAQLIYRWETPFGKMGFIEPGKSFSRLSFSIKGASRDFLQTYYEVSPGDVTSSRPEFQAKSGLLNEEITYFHTISSGRTSLYFGASLTNYSNSANRESPLHRSDRNVSYLVGLTYVLSESAKSSIPVEETKGLINKYGPRRLGPIPEP